MSIQLLTGAVEEAQTVAQEVVEKTAEVAQTVAVEAQKVVEVAAPAAETVKDWSAMLWTALICIVSVFFVLVLLIFVMKLFGVVFTKRPKNAAAPAEKQESGQIHEEEIAAITTALRLFSGDLHDRESEVLTIMNIKRAYSPWNSKIHGLTQMPDRKF